MTEVKKTILRSYAKNNMNVTSTAQDLHYHRNNIEYHLTHIQSKTGLNPRNFYDLIELLKEAGEE